MLDGQALAAAFRTSLKGQVIAALADAAALVVALDGKTVRGAPTSRKAPHLLAAMICLAPSLLSQLYLYQNTN